MPVGTMYTEAQMEELVEKRVTKLKKKYQKQIGALKSDLQEVKDEFAYQRQMLVDALSEQEKDSKLFETACKVLLSDREMRKLLEKSKWMEDEEEWVIPSLKRTDREGDAAGLPDIGNGNVRMNEKYQDIPLFDDDVLKTISCPVMSCYVFSCLVPLFCHTSQPLSNQPFLDPNLTMTYP